MTPSKPLTFLDALLVLAQWIEREAERRYIRTGEDRDDREWDEVTYARRRIEEEITHSQEKK